MSQSAGAKALNIKFYDITVNPIRNDYEGSITLQVKGESMNADFVAHTEGIDSLSNEHEPSNFNTLKNFINEEWLKLVKANKLPALS